MAIPRYEGGSTPFQQVDPTAAKASAQMFSTLSQRLDSWGDTLYEQAKVEVAEQGRDQAIKDMTSGDELRIEKGYGFYAKAYNDVSKAAFNASIDSDLKTASETYASQSKNDPEKYKATFGEWVKTTVSGIQEPEFKALAMMAGQKELGAKSIALTKEAFKNQRENDLKAIDAGIENEKNKYFDSYYSKDDTGMADSLAKINAMYQSKSKAGAMSEDMIPIENAKIMKEAYVRREKMDFQTMLDKGSTASALLQVSNKDHSKFLSIDERMALRKDITTMIKARNEEVEQAKKEDEQASLIDEHTTDKELRNAYINKTLKLQDIEKLYASGKIKLKTYEEFGEMLSSGTNKFGNKKLFNEMLPTALQGGLNIQATLRNPQLSQDQITTLIKTDQDQKDENRRQAIAKAQSVNGTIDAAKEHIALTQEASSLISKSFTMGSTKMARTRYKETVNRLNASLIELRSQAITEGKSSAWVYQQTQQMIESEKKLQLEQKAKEAEILNKGAKPKPLSWNDTPSSEVFYNNIMNLGELNA